MQNVFKALVDFISEQIASRMAKSRLFEKLVAAVFRTGANCPMCASLGRRVFSKFQRRAVASANCFRIIRLRSNTYLKLSLGDYLGSLYFNPFTFEPKTTRFVLEQLDRGDVFVDVGANIGYFALLAGACLRDKNGGRVLAFEPNPPIYELLKESIRLSKLGEIVTAVPCALSRVEQDKEMYLAPDDNTGLSTFRPWEGHVAAGVLSDQRVIIVQCRTLDSFFHETKIDRVDFIKIDVESAEFDVLVGANSTIEKFRPRNIICETSLTSESSNFLREKGYVSRLIEPLNLHHPDWGNVLFTLPTT